MTWNYLEGEEQRGPITEADFDLLVRAGKIRDDTYVWREGMAQWQPYGQVKGPGAGAAPAGQVVCAECGRSFPPDQVIRHGNASICATCKPVFLQKLKEGVAVTGVMNYAGFWIRVAAYLLDFIILMVVLVPLGFAFQVFPNIQPGQMPVFVPFRMFANQFLGLLIGVSYSTFFVGKYGATPGKMVAQLLVVNPDGSKVGYGKAAGRYLAAAWISGCFTLCIGYLMVAWDDEKRALHDRICSTRVIRK